MKGTYITSVGCVEVLNFDADNNIAYCQFPDGETKWVGKAEYDGWAKPVYVPDVPAQIIEEPKIESHAIQINTADEVDVRQQTEDGEGVGEGNAESEIIAEKSEIKSEEKVKKVRTPKNKK